jgi:hypothetical protein
MSVGYKRVWKVGGRELSGEDACYITYGSRGDYCWAMRIRKVTVAYEPRASARDSVAIFHKHW